MPWLTAGAKEHSHVHFLHQFLLPAIWAAQQRPPPGLLEWQRAGEAFQRMIFRQHLEGINAAGSGGAKASALPTPVGPRTNTFSCVPTQAGDTVVNGAPLPGKTAQAE
jgi:hypothetical protein